MANEKQTKTDTQIIAEAIGEAIRANRPQGPLDVAGFTEAEKARIVDSPRPKRWREIACRSEETGALFIACVVESARFAAGRIVAMKNYTHPPGVATYQKDGGLVPDGMQILRAGVAAPVEDNRPLLKQDCTSFYLQWRWQQFWKLDLTRYAGKEMKSYVAIDQAAFTTPWQEGTARVLNETG